MKYAHFVEMRVFSKEEDNEEQIKEKIRLLFPFEKLKIDQSTVIGFEDKKIRIFNIVLKNNSHINSFLTSLVENLSKEDKVLLEKQIDSRLDDALHFYIRLEKSRLLEGIYEITDSGNCFHFKISIATYPHSREKAKEILKQILKGL